MASKTGYSSSRLVKDEVLLIEGEMTPRLYFVLDGWLKVEKTSSEGRQQTIRYVGPGRGAQ